MTFATVQDYRGCTIIEITEPSLLDPVQLEKFAAELYPLIDEQDRRRMIVDFSRVTYLSSQAIGVLVTLHKKVSALPKALLVLCGVGPRLAELLKITRLDRVFTVKPTQEEAVRHFERMGLIR